MTKENAIEVDDLSKHYDGLKAVDHISFEVKRCELFGFLGPNGAGKTTTVRMLSGVNKPDTGRAYIMGFNVEEQALQAKQTTGILPETSNAYIDLSAWQNLMLMGKLYGLSKDSRHNNAKDLLQKFDLYDTRDVAVKKFSKGMKQRLLICMALINEPQVLILDEPTSGLDVQSARLIRSMITDLNKNGVTVFLTTHNMEEANQLCSRIVIINKGKIVTIGEPEILRKQIESLHSVEVSFDRDVEQCKLSVLFKVKEVKRIGNKFRLYTHEPDEVVSSLIDFARSNELKIMTLVMLPPTLEDAFVKYTEEFKNV